MAHENNIQDVRILLYMLVKSFFYPEPHDNVCKEWNELFRALEQSEGMPGISKSAGNMRNILENQGCKGVKEEYYRLFTDPYSKERLNITASFYADGKSLGSTLAKLRGLMQNASIEKDQGCPEPEDSLPVLLDSMALMLEEEGEMEQEIRNKIFSSFLQPLCAAVADRLSCLEGFPFYQACSPFIKEWLELEQPFFRNQGGSP